MHSMLDAAEARGHTMRQVHQKSCMLTAFRILGNLELLNWHGLHVHLAELPYIKVLNAQDIAP